MKTGSRVLKLLLIFMGMAFSVAEGWSQPVSEISRANHLYNQNRFEEGARIYAREIQGGRINGHLYYNLGNAYFRMGDLPRAILNYVKAGNLLPRNEDVKANLKYALRQTENFWDGRIPHPLESVFFWTHDLSLKEHWMALLGINLGFWITLAIRLHHPTPARRSARNIFLVLLVLAVFSTGCRWYQESRRSIGVVLPAKIEVHSGWNAGTATLLRLHQGSLVSISREKDAWYELELPGEKKGWVLQSEIAR